MYVFKFTFVFLVVLINAKSIYCKWNTWNGDLDWWQTTTVYQVYPKSFQDSDGDGIGDLKGIESRLDYFVDIGIKTLWLSPIFKSPNEDNGYDVSNYTDIDPMFGTLDDFKSLLRAMKSRGMNMLLDFVPNHTSDEHEWFKKSVQGIEPYKDYYMWKEGRVAQNGTITPPSNWKSLFGGEGWQWVEQRQQYYYHKFSVHQPELNLTNPDVKREMLDVLKFWLDLGVDGFRVDAVKDFVEDPEFHDEACFEQYRDNCDAFYKMYHNYTTFWPTSYQIVYEWRSFFDDYNSKSNDNHTRVLLLEVYLSMGEEHLAMAYYGDGVHNGGQITFNFYLIIYPNINTNASEYKRIISAWIDNTPDGHWPNWVTGNHDNHRVATRMGPEMVDGFYMLNMLLPGMAVTYQGEEIGQPDTPIRRDQRIDRNNNGGGGVDHRDCQRTPFMWDDSHNAGFSRARYTWLPVHPSYWEINVEAQKRAEKSHLQIYKQILQLRKTNTMQRGDLDLYAISRWVLAFTRKLPGNETYVIVINSGTEREIVHLEETITGLPKNLSVVVSSMNSGYIDGDIINTGVSLNGTSRPLILRPKASVVLTDGYLLHGGDSTKDPDTTDASPNGRSSAVNISSQNSYILITLLVSFVTVKSFLLR